MTHKSDSSGRIDRFLYAASRPPMAQAQSLGYGGGGFGKNNSDTRSQLRKTAAGVSIRRNVFTTPCLRRPIARIFPGWETGNPKSVSMSLSAECFIRPVESRGCGAEIHPAWTCSISSSRNASGRLPPPPPGTRPEPR